MHPPIILIGNKTDKQEQRQVSEDEGLTFAKKNKLDYVECSAYKATNIDLVFEAIVKKVIRERSKNEEGLMETPQGSKDNLNLRKLKKENNER